MSKYHLQTSLDGWLIREPAPLTATQISVAERLALTYGVTFETKSDTPGLGEFADGGTALGVVIALGVLAASVGLIRSETARDLPGCAAEPRGRTQPNTSGHQSKTMKDRGRHRRAVVEQL